LLVGNGENVRVVPQAGSQLLHTLHAADAGGKLWAEQTGICGLIRQSPHSARAWTMELKDRRIRVNSMSPGPIETPALETTTGLTAEQAEQAAAQFSSQIPMGRRGKPEEIAAAVTFLASDESSFITDVDLAVDGGMAQV
jgi:NADP-dependent 3-hydroxy acid dehydrogenase YdfG